jgi:hypothetical protein
MRSFDRLLPKALPQIASKVMKNVLAASDPVDGVL